MCPTVAACQIPLEDLGVDRNRSRVRECVRGLPEAVDLAVFPEHTLTGFVPDERIRAAALPRAGDAIDELSSLATGQGVALAVGFVEDAGDQYHNAVAYVRPEGDLTIYRKRHLWAGERDLLVPGSERVSVETPVGTAGVLTCYDLNFVENSAALACEGVTALLIVGAWPAAYSENWRLLLRARALDGVRWTIGANRTGTRDTPDTEPVTFGGRSMVARPDGGVHRSLDRGERTLVTDLDPAVLARQRDLIGVFAE